MAQNICAKCNQGLTPNAVKCPQCGEYNVKGLMKYGFALLYLIVVTIVYYRWIAK